MGKNKNIMQIVANDRTALLTAGLLASLEILKDEFGFTQEQLQKFSDKYVPSIQKNLGTKK